VIAPGSAVPEFTLRREDGSEFSRSELAGRRSVLIFYPFAFSPVCTDQLNLYDALAEELYALQVTKDAESLNLQATELKDQTTMWTNIGQTLIQTAKDQSQQVVNQITAATTQIKDTTQEITDFFQAVAQNYNTPEDPHLWEKTDHWPFDTVTASIPIQNLKPQKREGYPITNSPVSFYAHIPNFRHPDHSVNPIHSHSAREHHAHLPARTALRTLPEMIDYRYPHTGRLAYRAWDLRHTITFYDGLYVALAAALDMPLLTADGKLSQAPGLSCAVILLN